MFEYSIWSSQIIGTIAFWYKNAESTSQISRFSNTKFFKIIICNIIQFLVFHFKPWEEAHLLSYGKVPDYGPLREKKENRMLSFLVFKLIDNSDEDKLPDLGACDENKAHSTASRILIGQYIFSAVTISTTNKWIRGKSREKGCMLYPQEAMLHHHNKLFTHNRILLI